MKFQVFKSEKDDKVYFNLKAKNGQTILTSQGYKSKSGAMTGIESVKNNSGDDEAYERKESANGKYHFNLLAKNKQIVGRSQMYATKANMEKGIESVKNNAPEGTIDDTTLAS